MLKVVTPESLRHYLRRCKAISILSRTFKLVLLEYCLEDLVDADVGRHAYDLPLLPLASGDFGLFSEASKGISYFICNELEYMLLQKISDRVIDQSIPPNVLDRLSAVARFSTTNLVVLDVKCFLQLLPIFVPVDWKYRTEVFWDPKSNSNHPSASWFQLFWQYLRGQCENLSVFGDWLILPSLSGHLYRLSQHVKLLNMEKLSDKMQDVLVKIGCRILNSSHSIDHPDLFHYVHDADGTGVLESIFLLMILSDSCFIL